MIVKQLNLTSGVAQEVKFNEPHYRFLVKNFTSGDIKVSVGEPISEDNYAIIPSDSWEKISNNEKYCWDVFAADSLFVESANGGTVEVRVLC